MLINILLIWSIFELLNWINYIFIYFKLLKKDKKLINKKQINNFINEIKNSNKDEIQNIIKSSISYPSSSFLNSKILLWDQQYPCQ